MRGPVRTPGPVSTVVPRGGWQPGVKGETDHPGDPGVTKPRWAPSSSPFLSGASKGRWSWLGTSVQSGAPAGRAPTLHTQPVRLHLQAQVFSLRHKISASRARGKRPMRLEVIGKWATPPRTTLCPLHPCPSGGPLQPGALGQLGGPVPEAPVPVCCRQRACFVLCVARRELTVVSDCSRCPAGSLGRVRPRMGGRWGGTGSEGAQRSPGKGEDLKTGSQRGWDQHGRDSHRGGPGGCGWSPREELETQADRVRRNHWVQLCKQP